jgi:hypothetical protein
MSQEKYIGMDVHQATISVAVMDAGGKLIRFCNNYSRVAIIRMMWHVSLRTRMAAYGFAVSATFSICTLVLTCLLATAGQALPKRPVNRPSQNTLSVDCHGNEEPQRVLSSVALSEDETWRAYVEVNVQSKLGCLHTTRLWVAKADHPYRLIYLVPPKRDLAENGMEILGWARNSKMLLAKTELWQFGSDAADQQQVLALDASTGVVYEPELEAMLQGRKDKQCAFRVTDAGFSSDTNVVILVRAKFFTALEVDETESDVPAAKRCGNTEETWSFNYATGEVKQVGNAETLHLFKKFQPNRQAK